MADAATERSTSDPRPEAAGPLPIVGVTGTVGKTTVAETIDRVARLAGWHTVAWLDSGVTIDGQAQVGELTPWSRGLQLLVQGQLQLAVQELPAPLVQAVGLPAAAYRAVAVTNLAFNDPVFGATPRAAAQQIANRRVAAAVHPEGVVVLNADDLGVADLARTTPARVVLWALRKACPPLARHLAAGGHGWYVENGHLVYGRGAMAEPVLPLDRSPMAAGGANILQVQNLLAAAACLRAVGVATEHIVAGLSQLDGAPHLLDRRVVLEGQRRGRALIAAARCLPALRALARVAQRQAAGRARIVGTLAWPPALTDEEAAEAARIVARLFAICFVHGPGAEQAAALIAEARLTDRPPAVCRPVATEMEAVRRLVGIVAHGDYLLLVASTVPAARALLDSYDVQQP